MVCLMCGHVCGVSLTLVSVQKTFHTHHSQKSVRNGAVDDLWDEIYIYSTCHMCDMAMASPGCGSAHGSGVGMDSWTSCHISCSSVSFHVCLLWDLLPLSSLCLQLSGHRPASAGLCCSLGDLSVDSYNVFGGDEGGLRLRYTMDSDTHLGSSDRYT